ncbi:MAG TPA: UdgX family uracil-DNA binding protein [Acidimicrobiia bacterium]|nr:UdgX family uracil-DNA binding protein [Acidimicrobiia bacterium]
MPSTPPSDATPFLPEHGDLESLRHAAESCRGCDLWERATQTVFGDGPPSARIVLVGEQPGDQEDKEGQPFVGPAGRLLDRALEDAGIDRDTAYLTNAVKHFRWKATGGWRRIHEKPNRRQVRACRPWLDSELAAIDPAVVVALGATAAQSLMGPGIRVTRDRGVPLPWDPIKFVVVTIHPSSILRAKDQDREQAYDGLVADLRVAAGMVG